MGWKATGAPTVRRQRDKWVVRVDGIDTATGKHRPRQLGTYGSQRSAQKAARETRLDAPASEQGTVGWLVQRYVDGRTDISAKTREQYAWAVPHITEGLGAVKLARLDRSDVAGWVEELATAGALSRRSIQVCLNVLKASLRDAVDEGLIPRSPASRVALPRTVAKPAKVKETEAWSVEEVDRFLVATADHRWAIGFRLGVLYGLRRSEILALRWSNVDLEGAELRIEEGLVSLGNGMAWSDAKNERSRRAIPLESGTLRVLRDRRRRLAEERLIAGPRWEDHDLVISTVRGTPVVPRNFDRDLAKLIAAAGVPKLSSHGLRHTAATHMVASAEHLGDLRAVADLLGHSPEVLMKVYAHALPNHTASVVDRLRGRP